jgi:tetratricopeptide (TPR) repeat protein
LAKFEGLNVIARTSSFQFKGERVDLREVGRELQVNNILEGSVFSANDKIRITAQLIDVRDNTHIWSEKYDYIMADPFTIIDSVAVAVSSKFQLTFSGEKAPKSITTAAWDRYFKGTYQMSDPSSRESDSFEMAIKYFQEAIIIEPEFAAAYSGMAAAYVELTGWNGNIPPSEEYKVKCQEAAEKALELDPDQAEAYNVLGRITWRFENDWNKANTYFKKSMELNPTESWAYVEYMNFLTWMGDFDKSIALGKELIKMDPLSIQAHFELSFSYYLARRDQEYIDQCMKIIELDPDGFVGKLILSFYYIEKREFEKAADYAGITDSTRITIDTDPLSLLAFGIYYGYSGNTAKAEECLKILHQQRQGMSVYSVEIIWIYISLGRYDEALNIMEEAFNLDIKPAYLIGLKTQPFYDPLRDNPRFIRLLEQMKFDEYKME